MFSAIRNVFNRLGSFPPKFLLFKMLKVFTYYVNFYSKDRNRKFHIKISFKEILVTCVYYTPSSIYNYF